MIGHDELKGIELDILVRFAQICEENHLRYFLCGGTLLGAIRHKGFIPWDDDIDIAMPRPDYMRLMALAQTDLGDNYTLRAHYFQQDYTYPYAKVTDNRTVLTGLITMDGEMGVCIDVFPVDGLPSDAAVSALHFKKMQRILRFRSFSTLKNLKGRSFLYSVGKAPVVAYTKLFGTAHWLKKAEAMATSFDFDSSQYVAAIVSDSYGSCERIDRKSFSDYIKVDFEGRQFNAPAGYDRYLTNLYGDYMELPPEERRVTAHTFEAYWK